MRVSLAGILTALLATTLCSGAIAQVDEAELLRRLLRHDSMAAADRAVHAEGEAARAVTPAWPTPRLEVAREEVFPDQGSASATVVGVGLALDLSGRADLERVAGEVRADVARATRRVARLETACALRREALAAATAEARVEAIGETQAALRVLAAEVDRLVAAEERAAFAAERVILRVRTHDERLRSARADAQAARASLVAWVGPVDGPISATPAVPADLGAWTAAAVEASPRLDVERRRAQAARARRAVGERWWVPGVEVFGGWRVESPALGSDEHGYEASLAVELPFVDRDEPLRARADAEQMRARAAHARAEARLRAELAARVAALRALGPEEPTAGPRSDASGEQAGAPSPETHDDVSGFLDRARRRYRAGVGTLAELFDALASAEDARLARLERRHRRRASALELACAAGVFVEPELQALLDEATR